MIESFIPQLYSLHIQLLQIQATSNNVSLLYREEEDLVWQQCPLTCHRYGDTSPGEVLHSQCDSLPVI